MSKLLLQSNALQLPIRERSVHCIVTSPPYFHQRSYQTAKWSGGREDCNHKSALHPSRFSYPVSEKQFSNTGSGFSVWDKICPDCGAIRYDDQIGQEKTHDCLGWATGDPCGECYICHIREVARELYRVLRNDGTLWLNIGDSHNGSGGAGGDYNVHGFREGQKRYSGTKMDGVKPKSMLMIPARIAMALERDGWYLRVAIPWIKRNAYVEGVFDRPTTKIEYIYMLTKSRIYFYDPIAVIKEYKTSLNRWGGETMHSPAQAGWDSATGQTSNREGRKVRPNEKGRNVRPQDWFFDSMRAILSGDDMLMLDEQTNPLALVVNTEPSGVPHYATYPPSLVRPFILASTSEKGVCADCGAPIERIRIRDGKIQQRFQKNSSPSPYREGGMVNVYKTNGWQKTCNCATDKTKDSIVFDPFIGSGTTCVVAEQLGRHGVGVDLSTEYLRTAESRIKDVELPMLELLKGVIT